MSSDRKRMSVIVRTANDQIKLYCKGAVRYRLQIFDYFMIDNQSNSLIHVFFIGQRYNGTFASR